MSKNTIRYEKKQIGFRKDFDFVSGKEGNIPCTVKCHRGIILRCRTDPSSVKVMGI